MAFRFFFVTHFDGTFSSCFGLGKEDDLQKSFAFLQRSKMESPKIDCHLFLTKFLFPKFLNFPSSLIGSSWIAQVKWACHLLHTYGDET
jgi:hypothetical protein